METSSKNSFFDEMMRKGKLVNGKLQVNVDALLATTNIDSHAEVKAALQRLVYTNIEKDSKNDSTEKKSIFGFLDGCTITSDKDGRIRALEVILPNWALKIIETRKHLIA